MENIPIPFYDDLSLANLTCKMTPSDDFMSSSCFGLALSQSLSLSLC